MVLMRMPLLTGPKFLLDHTCKVAVQHALELSQDEGTHADWDDGGCL